MSGLAAGTVLRFVLDTGASNMTVTPEVADWLVRDGHAQWGLHETVTYADGKPHDVPTLTIYSVTVGTHTVSDAHASVIADWLAHAAWLRRAQADRQVRGRRASPHTDLQWSGVVRHLDSRARGQGNWVSRAAVTISVDAAESSILSRTLHFVTIRHAFLNSEMAQFGFPRIVVRDCRSCKNCSTSRRPTRMTDIPLPPAEEEGELALLIQFMRHDSVASLAKAIAERSGGRVGSGDLISAAGLSPNYSDK